MFLCEHNKWNLDFTENKYIYRLCNLLLFFYGCIYSASVSLLTDLERRLEKAFHLMLNYDQTGSLLHHIKQVKLGEPSIEEVKV